MKPISNTDESVPFQAKDDADMARIHAKQFDPNFKQPGTDALRRAGTAGNSIDSPRAQLSSDHSSRSRLVSGGFQNHRNDSTIFRDQQNGLGSIKLIQIG